jgi:two-component system, chemotaxis family, protein-glutamate methylesterase/glutaminase
MSANPLVVVGASMGGVQGLLQLAGALPAGFGAPVLVVQHIGDLPSILPRLLSERGPNPAVHARDGDAPHPGFLYVAPPDRHLLIDEAGTLRLSHGPKENHARPAIDPLFRSAALNLRERVIGVVLSGQLDDGTAGLAAVKECGGYAIVEDPATTPWPSMPQSALDNVAVDECLPLESIAAALARRISGPASPPHAAPPTVEHEVRINQGIEIMDNLQAIATPSSLTCPDCGGGLWEVRGDKKPLRYRCHTGHAFTAQTLSHAQGQAAEHALWSSVRSLQEKEMLFHRVAEVAKVSGQTAQMAAAQAQAARVRAQADALIAIIESGSAPA